MSLAIPPSALRTPVAAAGRRPFSTSAVRPASPIFMLSALSNSRETQHLNKLSRLSRVEHSPSLKLIQTSEVDPYPLPVPPPARLPVLPAKARTGSESSPARIWDEKALKAGRAILMDGARRISRLQRALERAKRREATRSMTMKDDRATWQREVQHLRRELHTAGILVLLSVGTATALASWRFWPRQGGSADTGRLGEKMAEAAATATPVPALAQTQTPTLEAVSGLSSARVQQQLSVPISSASPPSAAISKAGANSSPWKSLLWKHD